MARKRRDTTIKLVLRLPPALHRRLTRVASRNNRSLNSEMVQRLDDSFGEVALMHGKRYRWVSEDTLVEDSDSEDFDK
jgi:hypothetical protein